jgi:hypothetical protein
MRMPRDKTITPKGKYVGSLFGGTLGEFTKRTPKAVIGVGIRLPKRVRF